MTQIINFIKTNPFFHSIRFRLVLWFSSILIVVLILFSTFIYYIQARDLRRDSLEQLDGRMVGLQQSLVQLMSGSSGTLAFPTEYIREQDIFILVGENGQVINSKGFSSPQEIILQANSNIQSNQIHGEASSEFVSWSGSSGTEYQNYNFVIAPINVNSRKLSFIILASPIDIYRQLDHLRTNLLLGSLATLIIALVGGIWLADRAMRPVKTITHAARNISENDLSVRLNLTGEDELSELAKTFDEMLSRLQTSFERQRQFVADASHELRTPLTIINLQTNHALASDRSKKEYKKAFSIIQSENNFMTSMVNDLLMLARMDSGQAILEYKPLDLSEIVVDAVEHLAPLAESRNIRLETGDLQEMPILGDRKALFQMLSNLIENGIKYNSSKAGFICVELEKMGEWVMLKVLDNGPGISAEHIPHLFDRFYRVGESRSRDFIDTPGSKQSVGSGLGLSIAQWIVQAHNGEIDIESEFGTGTCFKIRFPVRK